MNAGGPAMQGFVTVLLPVHNSDGGASTSIPVPYIASNSRFTHQPTLEQALQGAQSTVRGLKGAGMRSGTHAFKASGAQTQPKHAASGAYHIGAPKFSARQPNTPSATNPPGGARKTRKGQRRQPGGGGGAKGAAPEDVPNLHPLWKTRLCNFYQSGACRNATGCPFAHGADDLRPSPDFERTSVCPILLNKGRCDKANCRYAHSCDELRSASGLLKTKMCSFFLKGLCVVGEACRFAHSEEELQDAIQVQRLIATEPEPSEGMTEQRNESLWERRRLNFGASTSASTATATAETADSAANAAGGMPSWYEEEEDTEAAPEPPSVDVKSSSPGQLLYVVPVPSFAQSSLVEDAESDRVAEAGETPGTLPFTGEASRESDDEVELPAPAQVVATDVSPTTTRRKVLVIGLDDDAPLPVTTPHDVRPSDEPEVEAPTEGMQQSGSNTETAVESDTRVVDIEDSLLTLDI